MEIKKINEEKIGKLAQIRKQKGKQFLEYFTVNFA